MPGERVSCHCRICDQPICTSVNEWVSVTNSYSTYTNAESFSQTGLTVVGQIRPGATDSELEGCSLQPLQCSACKTGLGIKCVETPQEKEQYRDLSFIKLAKLKLMSISTDEEVDPLFKETATDSLPLTSHATLTNGLANGKASSRRSDFGHDKIVPGNPPQLPQEPKTDSHRWTKMIDQIQHEVKSARKGMADLKTTFEEELDNLAESVSAFTSRISEIDALNLEVKTLKRRLQRLEHGNSSSQFSHTVKDSTEDYARHSRLAKVTGMVERKPKTGKSAPAAQLRRPTATSGADEIIESDMPDKSSARKAHPPHTSRASKFPLQYNPATRVNSQSHGNNGSQSSSSDMESYVSPIPATRPGVTKFPSSSSVSGTSGVALEFEPQPNQTPSVKPRKKPASAVALNNHKVIPSSDPEEVEYRPRTSNSAKPRRGRGLVPSRGVRRVGRPRKAGLRLPDPELESPDCKSKSNTPWSHKRGIVRRGVSGRVLTVRSEPKRRGRPPISVTPSSIEGYKGSARGRPVNEVGIPLRPDGKPDRRYLKKTVRDATGVLRYAAAEGDGTSGQIGGPPDASPKTYKRAHSEGEVGVDDSDQRDAKKPKGDGIEITDEDLRELDWRWGIRQQSA